MSEPGAPMSGSQIERWVSPDGQRVAILDPATGEVWLMRRLGPGEAAEVMTLLGSWTFREEDDAPGLPCRPPSRPHLRVE